MKHAWTIWKVFYFSLAFLNFQWECNTCLCGAMDSQHMFTMCNVQIRITRAPFTSKFNFFVLGTFIICRATLKYSINCSQPVTQLGFRTSEVISPLQQHLWTLQPNSPSLHPTDRNFNLSSKQAVSCPQLLIFKL